MLFIEKLLNYFKASYPAVAIQTCEEQRALGDCLRLGQTLKRNVLTWSATEGARLVAKNGEILSAPQEFPDTTDLLAATRIREENALIILRDAHTWPFESDPILTRGLRDMICSAPSLGSTIVLISPEFRPHPTIEKNVTVLDYALPSDADLRTIAEGIAKSAKIDKAQATNDVIKSLSGLSTTEAENALAFSFADKGGFDAKLIYELKVQAVKRGGLLDIVDPDPRGLDAIGGLDALKDWILKRKRAWSPEAQAFGVPEPKGILLVGVPGTGKSLASRAVGTALGLPALRLDIGSLFNSLVGESEARTRDALKLAEAMAPCVLWVDEIDKGLAGANSGASGDSGVTKRVFGTIISWMQERKRSVFLVATANDVSGLPPEFLRKGRFDELFAVDVPTSFERQEILAIHLRKRGRDPSAFELESIAEATPMFTGSELEAVVNEALTNAFYAEAELDTAALFGAAQGIVPLATTAKEQVDGIRQWAKQRAKAASVVKVDQNQNARKLKS